MPSNRVEMGGKVFSAFYAGFSFPGEYSTYSAYTPYKHCRGVLASVARMAVDNQRTARWGEMVHWKYQFPVGSGSRSERFGELHKFFFTPV